MSQSGPCQHVEPVGLGRSLDLNVRHPEACQGALVGTWGLCASLEVNTRCCTELGRSAPFTKSLRLARLKPRMGREATVAPPPPSFSPSSCLPPLTCGSWILSWLSDCPQVQCVRTYKALQPDELTLEKTDILAVKTRTSDGENQAFLTALLRGRRRRGR